MNEKSGTFTMAHEPSVGTLPTNTWKTLRFSFKTSSISLVLPKAMITTPQEPILTVEKDRHWDP